MRDTYVFRSDLRSSERPEERGMTKGTPTDDASFPLESLAERLEYLFDRIRPTSGELAPGEDAGRRYTNKEIADKINHCAREIPGAPTISAAYIGELRRGVAADPRTSHVQALAKAFGVDCAFFVDDRAARRVQDQIMLLNELRSMDVKQVALRRVLHDSGLSRTSASLVEQMVARLREVERQVDEGHADGRPPASD
jgi:transcriptional regulator with XRE-family HTH domain